MLSLISTFKDLINFIPDFIDELIDKLQEDLSSLQSSVETVSEAIEESVDTGYNSLSALLDEIKNNPDKVTIQDLIDLGDKGTNFLSRFNEIVRDIAEEIVDQEIIKRL